MAELTSVDQHNIPSMVECWYGQPIGCALQKKTHTHKRKRQQYTTLRTRSMHNSSDQPHIPTDMCVLHPEWETQSDTLMHDHHDGANHIRARGIATTATLIVYTPRDVRRTGIRHFCEDLLVKWLPPQERTDWSNAPNSFSPNDCVALLLAHECAWHAAIHPNQGCCCGLAR